MNENSKVNGKLFFDCHQNSIVNDHELELHQFPYTSRGCVEINAYTKHLHIVENL